jgi:hypothetical protein
MATAPANGQFGRDEFLVFSRNGVSDHAKYLKDVSGRNYILNPNTGEPYIVPKDYTPSATANYFRGKFNQFYSAPLTNTATLPSPLPEWKQKIYDELIAAFKQGGWGDLQRPLRDKTDVFRDYIDAASFNLGAAAAGGNVTALEAIIGGGLYNAIKNGKEPDVKKDYWQFGNNPNNPPHIREGYNSTAAGAFTVDPAVISENVDRLDQELGKIATPNATSQLNSAGAMNRSVPRSSASDWLGLEQSDFGALRKSAQGKAGKKSDLVPDGRDRFNPAVTNPQIGMGPLWSSPDGNPAPWPTEVASTPVPLPQPAPRDQVALVGKVVGPDGISRTLGRYDAAQPAGANSTGFAPHGSAEQPDDSTQQLQGLDLLRALIQSRQPWGGPF